MMGVAGGKECRLITESLSHPEAENASVEIERPLQVGNLQMRMTNAHTGVNRVRLVAHTAR